MSRALAEEIPTLSKLDLLLAIEDPDTLVRRAVELARDIIGLVRVSIYLRERGRHFIMGTWASNACGAIVDEHHIMFATTNVDAWFRHGDEGAQYSVLDECLIVEHRPRGTDVSSRGWVACTPIRDRQTIGLMFNDAGHCHAVFDEAKQAQAALLCSLLGTALGALRRTQLAGAVADRLPMHRLVMAAVAMLSQDPGVGLGEIAEKLGVGLPRLGRIFKANLGVSLSDYRNRLRLDRVALLSAKGHTSLAGAAIAAGFKSPGQFQQVSKAFRRTALPRRLAK
jgi:AraC-like DNA-binding protein